MKSGELVTVMAEATGQSAPSVKLAMRVQREAGQLTSTGARGRGAPHMTPRDAATVLIGFMAQEVPGLRAAEAVKSFGPLVCQEGNRKGEAPLSLEALRDLRPPFTFLDAVAEEIARYAFDADSDAFRTAETRLRDGSTLSPRVPHLPAPRHHKPRRRNLAGRAAPQRRRLSLRRAVQDGSRGPGRARPPA